MNVSESMPETLRIAEDCVRHVLPILARAYRQDNPKMIEPAKELLYSRIAQALTDAVQGAREAALEEAGWAAHGKIVDMGLAGVMVGSKICPADISCEISNAISALKPQPPASQGTGGVIGELIDTLADAYSELLHCQIFIRSNQKMAPFGQELHSQMISSIEALLARAKGMSGG